MKPAVDAFRKKGVEDFDAYFSVDPDLIRELELPAEAVNITSTTLTMYAAKQIFTRDTVLVPEGYR